MFKRNPSITGVSHMKFRQSGYTTALTLLDLPFVFGGTYFIMNSQWILAITCLIASIGMGMLQIDSLAADYAKWRKGVERHEFNEGNNGDA